MGLLGADDEPDDEVGRLVANARGDSVTRERLTETKEGIVTKNLSGQDRRPVAGE
ncbi:hypothetical protein [Halorussus salinisoli]|uniref:hypothetical protein n=1 Tax=Halorussus salinisoli TaxID=2558242 RepID=UPI001484D916|nr:hypothetical protein [Halorussus salinisoli]